MDLDFLPLWGVFVATLGVILLALEGGFRLGRYRGRRPEHEKESPVGAVVAAVLGLLGFLLAFTFGLAASRFEDRRKIVVDEANAIGTAYLRAEMLPEPQRTAIRKLLHRYADVRSQGAHPDRVEQAIAESVALQQQVWSQAVAVAERDPKSIITGIFVQALNDVIDLHSKRIFVALRSRIPGVIWLVLYVLAVLAMATIGFHAGLVSANRSPVLVALALTFTVVLYLIADLDRPQEGLLRVSQQSLVELRSSMNEPDH